MDIRNQVLDLFNDDNPEKFEILALNLFRHQSEHNKVYRDYLDLIHIDPKGIRTLNDIPLMPISLYKSHYIKTGDWKEVHQFVSSGTTKMIRSVHYVRDLEWYNRITELIFDRQVGALDDYVIFACLPSYTDNAYSSLIHMVKHFMDTAHSGEDSSVYFISDFAHLRANVINKLDRQSRKILLIGVTFALLDFAERQKIESDRLDIMFTGGMKNKREELNYDEIVFRLKKGFPHSRIVAEYGMTELFSQCYSENGLYRNAPTLKIMPKEISDPFAVAKESKTARLGVIDLANIDTCAFILTDDLCQVKKDSFQILGRMDNSDLRGCNMLYHLS